MAGGWDRRSKTVEDDRAATILTYSYSYISVRSMKRALLRRIDPVLLSRAAEIIKMLGHPERLKIVEVLERGEATVSEIQEAIGIPQAIVSQHLARMRGCNIVAARRDGSYVRYRVIEPKVHHVLNCIRECDA